MLSLYSAHYVYRNHHDAVRAVAWHPKGTLIASASEDTTIHVREIRTGKLFIFNGHSDIVAAVAWAPDGRHIASASLDGTVKIWNGKRAMMTSHSENELSDEGLRSFDFLHGSPDR
jgi:WD40 repeat protein